MTASHVSKAESQGEPHFDKRGKQIQAALQATASSLTAAVLFSSTCLLQLTKPQMMWSQVQFQTLVHTGGWPARTSLAPQDARRMNSYLSQEKPSLVGADQRCSALCTQDHSSRSGPEATRALRKTSHHLSVLRCAATAVKPSCRAKSLTAVPAAVAARVCTESSPDFRLLPCWLKGCSCVLFATEKYSRPSLLRFTVHFLGSNLQEASCQLVQGKAWAVASR